MATSAGAGFLLLHALSFQIFSLRFLKRLSLSSRILLCKFLHGRKHLLSLIFCQRLTFCVVGFVLLFSFIPHTCCHQGYDKARFIISLLPQSQAVMQTPSWLSGGSLDLLRDGVFKFARLLKTALYRVELAARSIMVYSLFRVSNSRK